jgi:uncharacterized protein (TIGR03437 family)
LLSAATFGTVVTVTGDPGDLVLDEARSRLYILNTTAERVDIYSTSQRRITSSFTTGTSPLSAAMSRNGKYLYVTSYSGSALEIYDLEALALLKKVSLPSSPEGVAVGGDERVLITTVGGGSSTSTDNRLMLYDPNSTEGLRAIATTLPPPAAAQIASPPTEIFQASRSRLATSADGRYIIGLDNPTTTTRLVFVYEVASGTVLRSRQITSISSVLSVSPDGSKFMAGLSLFETDTLAIVAQQNTANSLYPFASNANFNTQQNQGGSVFAPDGSVLYSGFNVAPVQIPAARANSSQMMLSDPDNLLIKLGLQLPENLVGKMVITANGATVYALSQSGVLVLPVSTIYDSPLAIPESNVVLVTNDQCGATAATKSVRVKVGNGGKGRMSVTAQVNSGGTTFTFPLGGSQGTTVPDRGAQTPGAGGGAPGGGIVIPFPTPAPDTGAPVITNPGQVTIPPGFTPGSTDGQLARTPTQQSAVTSTAPLVSVEQGGTEATAVFTYNPSAGNSIGTILPTDFLIQSQEAINIPPRIRVYQNNRNAEAVATILPAPISVSTAEALVDMVMDNARQKIYVANSGLNRVEVLDAKTNQFMSSIKVGQLPRSLAMSPDGNYLYVANSGGESISIIDLDKREVTGKVKFPPVPYNASFALNTPSTVAAGLNGLQVVMSNGKVWRVVNGEALPRATNGVLGTTTLTSPYNMVATPGGEYILLLNGNGTAYLYDAMKDDFVLSQAVVTTPIQGYFGAITAGPRGQYYVVNGNLLNASLTLVASAALPGSTVNRPISAVAVVGANQFARFVQPTRTSANAAVTESPTVEVADTTSGQARGGASAPEGPLSTQSGTARVNMTGKQMAVDAAGTTAYLLTTSGVSVVSLAGAAPTVRPVVASGGVVNSASYGTAIAPGSVVSIFGSNLANDARAGTSPLPTVLGGVCATLNNKPLSLLLTSPTQINVQVPVELAAGRYPLVIRSLEKNVASGSQSVTVAKVAPAVYTQSSGYAALYHKDGRPVTSSNPASRDEPLVMYATGLGTTTGGKVTTGQPAPSNPLAVTGSVQVYFGDPAMKQSEVIVDWSGLAPGFIGLYQLNLRVPGAHTKGDPLPVTIKIGGVTSPTNSPVVPKVAVD